MNVKDYEYIVTLSEYDSITRAAEQLNVTAGALSKYVLRVEAELGLPLFKRLGNRLIITDSGRRYVEIGKAIMNLDKELMQDMSSMIDRGDAAIHFGAPRGMRSFLMEQVLPEFYKESKEPVSLITDASKTLIRMLEEGVIDVIISYTNETKDNIARIFLAHVDMVLAVPDRSPLLDMAVRKPGEKYPVLDDDRWLLEPYVNLPSNTASGRYAEAYFRQSQVKPPIRLYAEDTATALSAVENGIGNCILYALPQTERLVHFLKVPLPGSPGSDVCILYRKNDCMTPGTKTLIQMIQHNFADYS